MTIGLYDIDFWHGKKFSISLPLMKIYNYYYKLGHHVIMMKPYEKTERFNKVFYFKDNPELSLPSRLKIDLEKGVIIGYGFIGKSGIKKEEILNTNISFTPYDLYSDKIKNTRLYSALKKHGVIDWREKWLYNNEDSHILYVNDTDFLKEEDWKELFLKYPEKSIYFTHYLRSDNNTDMSFLLSRLNSQNTVIIPWPQNLNEIKTNIVPHKIQIDGKNYTAEDYFKLIFAVKTLTNCSIYFVNNPNKDSFINQLIKWGRDKRSISYAEFMSENYQDKDYSNFKYKLLLKQNPQNYNEQDLINNKIIKI